MVRTYGLTHISLAVRDLDAALRFYQAVFGVEVVYRDGDSMQVATPGANDVIAFERVETLDTKSGGVAHFGFRLMDPADIDIAIAEVEHAGGKLVRRGEFAPGSPFAYVNDPDGYEIEIWFE